MPTKVLIAHGNTQRLKRAVADLQARGFEVAATPDGGDAFARFFEEGPDVVICSESLPGLSGANFARMVRSQSPATVVVLLVEGEPSGEAVGCRVQPDPLDVDALCRAIPDLVPAAPAAAPAKPSRATTTLEVFTLSALKRFQRGSHLLALLDDAGVAQMARMAEQRTCADGERVVCQGESGDSFYLVVEGQVRVTLREQGDAEVARIGEGGFFGEMALLSDQPRQASVWSVGTTTLLRFGRAEFLPMLDAYPSMRELLSGVALERSEENLWSVLLADDEVQQSLAELDDDGRGDESTPAPPPDRAEQKPLSVQQRAGAPDAAPILAPGASNAPPPELDAAVADLLAAEQAAVAELSAAAVDEARAEGTKQEGATHETARRMTPAAGRASQHSDARGEFQALRPPTPPGVLVAFVERIRRMAREASREALVFVGAAGFVVGIIVTLLVAGMMTRHDSSRSASPTTPSGASTGLVGAGGAVTEDDDRGRSELEVGSRDAREAPNESTTGPNTRAQPSEATHTAERSGASETESIAEPPRPEREPSPLSDAERKELRKQFFARYRAKDYAGAVEVGHTLRATAKIDWEAEFLIAEVERAMGANDEALASYLAFVEKYPTNVRADDAQFWAAEILLAQGKMMESKALYQSILMNPKTRYRSSAEARLNKL